LKILRFSIARNVDQKKRKKKGKKGCLKHFTFIFKLVIKKENTGTQWVMTERGYK
jgi:hypothetical protein